MGVVHENLRVALLTGVGVNGSIRGYALAGCRPINPDGVTMDEYDAVRAALRSCAAQVHGLAARLATHGLGDRWEGPTRRQCELRLLGLEDDLRLIARQLEVVASSFGTPDVRARLG